MLDSIIRACSKNYFKTEQFSWGSEAFNLHLKYLELKRPTSVCRSAEHINVDQWGDKEIAEKDYIYEAQTDVANIRPFLTENNVSTDVASMTQKKTTKNLLRIMKNLYLCMYL